MDYPAPLARLVDELRRLPGVGPKSAQRIAFHLLKAPKEEAERLAEAVGQLQEALRLCSVCNAITDREVMGKLEAMGVEFMSKAVELDGTLAPLAAPVRVGARSS